MAALLGIVLGVLLTLVSGKVFEKKEFDGDYNRWRKLNLILQALRWECAVLLQDRCLTVDLFAI